MLISIWCSCHIGLMLDIRRCSCFIVFQDYHEDVFNINHSGGIQFPICLIIFMSVKLPGSSNFEMKEFYHQMRISNKNISLWIRLPMFLRVTIWYTTMHMALVGSGIWFLLFSLDFPSFFPLLDNTVEGGAWSPFRESPCLTQWVLSFTIRAGKKHPGCPPDL